ncbi:beta-1,3-galactosyltransferase 1-like isoform X2 [Condylostylus longicornis]|nr:beta-1,3-galactosyltransferase 1-like isoform X2 [Condylostylus longicornis]
MGKHSLKAASLSFSKSGIAAQPLLCNEKNYERNEEQHSLSTKSNRHQIHRRARRLVRIFLISLGISSLCFFLYVYIPILSAIHSRSMSISGWGYNTSKDTANYVYPNRDTTLINPSNVCSNNFFLLIVVTSSITNFAERLTIRETWGNVTEFNYPMFSEMHSNNAGGYLNVKEMVVRMHADHLNLPNVTNISNFTELINNTTIPVKVVFLIGRGGPNNFVGNETISRLKVESEQYGDLIQEDFVDTYNNLTLKSVMMLKWIQQKCLKKMKFVLKCDDDTFVNVPNLLHFLLGGTIPVYKDTLKMFDSKTVNALAPSNRMIKSRDLLIGYMFCDAKPISDITNKWYTPMYMYAGEKYPNYLSGSGYLMSTDVVGKLYDASLNVSIFHLEDVYVTGICAEKAKVKRRHNPLFIFHHSHVSCSYKGIITRHYLNTDELREYYNFVANTTIKCPKLEKYFRLNRLQVRLKNCN